jgi:hypothetical protein
MIDIFGALEMVEARNQVRFEDTGIKRLKHGEPDKTKMAKEVMDVLRCILHVVDYDDLGVSWKRGLNSRSSA